MTLIARASTEIVLNRGGTFTVIFSKSKLKSKVNKIFTIYFGKVNIY